MTKRTRKHADDLRAASKLVVTSVTRVNDAVEDVHRTIASGPRWLGKPLAIPARLLTFVAYRPTRLVMQVVGAGIDALLSQFAPYLGESVPGAQREAVVAALNGVVGDYLRDTENPLAIEMQFRRDGAPLALTAEELDARFPDAETKLLILVHGSSMNDLGWTRHGHDHGAALSREFGYAPIYLYYNSGLHISTNGREFATLLEQLVEAWPVPVDEVSILCHSMGGLVTRSACHIAEVQALSWRRKLRRFVCLGSPHHGSAMERGGSWLHAILGATEYSAPIGKLARLRGAGITDMRFGYVLDEHWEGRDRFALHADARANLTLPDGVQCYAIAGSTSSAMSGRVAGDGVVAIESALGKHARRDLTLPYPPSHQWVALGTSHLDLLSRPEVYAQLRSWFASAEDRGNE